MEDYKGVAEIKYIGEDIHRQLKGFRSTQIRVLHPNEIKLDGIMAESDC